MNNDDAELVALIDNELDPSARTRLLERLKSDEGLRARYGALRDAGAPIAASFDALVASAPVARLAAALRSAEAVRAALSRGAWRDRAAGLAVGVLVAGAAAWLAWSLAPRPESGDWRDAVAEYVQLYTPDTFAALNPDRALEEAELSALGAKVGGNLTAENVEIPGLAFKAAMIFAYDGAPLGEIAYVDDKGRPVMFCVMSAIGGDAPALSEKRENVSFTAWSRGGRGYMVVGALPAARVADLAATLEKRF
jgi:anti-sigma factor RsiW